MGPGRWIRAAAGIAMVSGAEASEMGDAACDLPVASCASRVWSADRTAFAYLFQGQIWLRLGRAPGFPLTRSGSVKSGPEVSPDGSRIAWYGQYYGGQPCDSPASGCAAVMGVADFSGEIRVPEMTLTMRIRGDTRLDCVSVVGFEWIDDRRIGVDCHMTPALDHYEVVDADTGRIEAGYDGFGFIWSPDRRSVAHVGFMPASGGPLVQNYCMMVNGEAVSSPQCINEVAPDGADVAHDIHEFANAPVWSPDSRRVAWLETVFDWRGTRESNGMDGVRLHERHYLALAGAGQRAAGFEIPATALGGSLAWADPSHVRLESAAGIILFDLEATPPLPLP
jgi:hypothetical protein